MSRKACIIGGGVIGGGWAARFLLNGWDAAVFDPDPQAARKVGEVLDNARRALPALYDAALPAEGTLSFHNDLAQALKGAAWVQESVPERLDLKHRVHADVTRLADSTAVIGSSTSGFKPSELTTQGARVIVAHPFNPVYLLPLVELVGTPEDCTKAATILRGIGMYPLTVTKEIDAHIADRLLEAVWRESLWLVKDGIATTAEIDEAIRMGFGLRWAQMGLFETYRIAGGEAGMAHFMEQFGPALSWPWTKLMDVPELTPELVALIAGQSDAQSGHLSIRQLERLRDDNLVDMMRALKHSGSGAGGVLTAHETSLRTSQTGDLPVTVSRMIPPTWADANGHVGEAHHMELASHATNAVMETLSMDASYADAGHSFIPQRSAVEHHHPLQAGAQVQLTSQLLSGAGGTLHLFHRITDGDGTLCATVETMLLHMDVKRRAPSAPSAEVLKAVEQMAKVHSALPQPKAQLR